MSQFADLPKELRQEIWKWAVLGPAMMGFIPTGNGVQLVHSYDHSTVGQTCKEAWKVMTKTLCKVEFAPNPRFPPIRPTWIDFSQTVFYLGSAYSVEQGYSDYLRKSSILDRIEHVILLFSPTEISTPRDGDRELRDARVLLRSMGRLQKLTIIEPYKPTRRTPRFISTSAHLRGLLSTLGFWDADFPYRGLSSSYHVGARFRINDGRGQWWGGMGGPWWRRFERTDPAVRSIMYNACCVLDRELPFYQV